MTRPIPRCPVLWCPSEVNRVQLVNITPISRWFIGDIRWYLELVNGLITNQNDWGALYPKMAFKWWPHTLFFDQPTLSSSKMSWTFVAFVPGRWYPRRHPAKHHHMRFWLTHILPIWKRGPGGSTADQCSKLCVRQHQTSKSEFGGIVSRICHFIGVSYPFFYCPPVFGWTAHQRQRVSLPRSCWKDSEKQACLSAKKCGCKKQRCGAGVPMELLNPWRF